MKLFLTDSVVESTNLTGVLFKNDAIDLMYADKGSSDFNIYTVSSSNYILDKEYLKRYFKMIQKQKDHQFKIKAKAIKRSVNNA